MSAAPGPATAARQIREGSLTSVALVSSLIQRTRTFDPTLRSTISLEADAALASARAADDTLRRKEPVGPLHGVPFGVKDCIATAGIRTTANSRQLSDWVPHYDAPAVAALRRAGAIVLAKHNLNEFAWSIPGEDDLCPPPRNPWQPASYAMGSSSGSAVSVAAEFCPFAIGTDAGGSVRQPAANCGIYGLKPTHGLVPSGDAFAQPSICEVGPLARGIEDIAVVLEALGSAPGTHELRRRIGVLQTYIEAVRPNSEISASVAEAQRSFADVGFEVHPVEVEGLADAAAADFVVLKTEAYLAHAQRIREHPELIGASAQFYIMSGASLSSADYSSALRVGEVVREYVNQALYGLDALVTPVSPVVTAEEARATMASPQTGGAAVFTAPFNLTGHPSLAVPCGISERGIPIGLQLVGRFGEEGTLLTIGAAYERATPWHTLRPSVAAVRAPRP